MQQDSDKHPIEKMKSAVFLSRSMKTSVRGNIDIP